MKVLAATAITLAVSAAGLLAYGGVGWTNDAPLAGRWSCKGAFGQAAWQLELFFRNDGALSTKVWLRVNQSGHAVSGKIASEDRWAVRGNQLMMNHGDATIISATSDGRNIPREWAGILIRAYGGMAIHAYELPSDSELVYQTVSGPVKCTK